MKSFSHWGMFEVPSWTLLGEVLWEDIERRVRQVAVEPPTTFNMEPGGLNITYQKLNFGPELS